MKNADKWIQPTAFTGNYPDWAGFTFLDWDVNNNVFHPGDDYNFGFGDQDFGQAVKSTANGIVVYTSKSMQGYGNLCIIKHTLGYNLKRFIKENYGIETDVLYSLYAHLKDMLVSTGNEIDADALIGHIGKSGTKWAHLHFEIYQAIPDTGWRYYPTGKSKEWIQDYYLPAYKFIESTKNIESYDNYLGKPKDYWLQVEKDREALLNQIGSIDQEWSKKLQKVTNEFSTCTIDSATLQTKLESCATTSQKERDDFAIKLATKQNEVNEAKNRITEVLKDNADNYKFIESLKLVVYTIGNMFKNIS